MILPVIELNGERFSVDLRRQLLHHRDNPDHELAFTGLDGKYDQRSYETRLSGVLPRIDIGGEDFTVDVRVGELRHARYPDLRLPLDRFQRHKDGMSLQAFYDIRQKQLAMPDPELTELPNDLVLLRIPNELQLDPVGTGWRYGILSKVMARLLPPGAFLKAQVLPLTESGLPVLVQQNKARLAREHRQLMERSPFKLRP